MEKVDIAIVGAGLIGLALAWEFSQQKNQTVVVIEQNYTYGLETSSRNSQVIHSGIYYPACFLKTRLCIQGRHQLYEYCGANRIDHKKLGKLIVAVSEDEVDGLDTLLHQAKLNGVKAHMIDQLGLQQLEPLVHGFAALLVPDAGIVDVHQLMASLYYQGRQNKVIYAYNSPLTGLEYIRGEYVLTTARDQFKADQVINSAGLNSDSIPRLLGLDFPAVGERLHPCKGEYYSLRRTYSINHLVYPLPSQSGSLGIHLTPDLSGYVRLGPNAYETAIVSYDLDDTNHEAFYESARRMLPDLQLGDIVPDFCGIRPRRNSINESTMDFLIQEETTHGYPGLINLIGIESPGLTSCLAIAKYVHGLSRMTK